MLAWDVKLISTTKSWRAAVMTHERYKLKPQGALAIDIVRALSLCILPDGETSTGEQKHRSLTAKEIVDKAVAISELVYATIESRGWVQDLPSLEDMEKFAGEEESTGFLTKAKEVV